MNYKKLIFTAIAMVLLVSCGKKSEQAKVEMVDGVRLVHNPATPLYPDKKVTFEEELSIGGEDENGEIILYQPIRLAVDDDGNIYVADMSDSKIKVFDAQGNFIRSIGEKGQGPGEFSSIGGIQILPNGNLIALDYRNRRTSIFDKNGKFLSSYTWKNHQYLILLTTDSSYTIQENVYEKGDRKLFVKTYNFEGKELVNFGEFKPSGVKILRKGNIAFGIGIPYTPASIFAGDQERGWLYHCYSANYLIEAYDRNGKLFRKIDRPYEPLPVTKKDREEFRRGFDNNPNKVFAEMAKDVELPDVKAVADALIVDDKGNLWVMTNEGRKQQDDTYTAFDIFDKDGIYIAKIWINHMPRVFKNGKMFTITTDEETDERVVKRYRVVWSEE